VNRPGPLLSIVVPIHRVERYLPRCLDSILAGSSDEVEVVGVDDWSPDSSGAVLDAYARRDPRVRAVHLTTNVGLGRARNVGLACARANYVWFVDSDDWLPGGAVPAVAGRLAATAPDVLVLDHAVVEPDGRWFSPTPPGVLGGPGVPAPLAHQPQLLNLAHSACTKVVRRQLLDDTGLRFFPGWYEDGPFSHALLLSAPRIDTLDRICYCYRQRPDEAITGSVSDRHFDVFTQYDRLWSIVDGQPAYERFRPTLFRLMMDHYLVIAGNGRRVPPARRREFFARMVADYRRRQPADGYPVPAGAAGVKHRLVRRDAYRTYALLRMVWRSTGPLRRSEHSGPAPAPAPYRDTTTAR
jgi:glycosyltransferase involved in cell wall biosynthesis